MLATRLGIVNCSAVMGDLVRQSLREELRSFGTATVFAAHPSVQVLPDRIKRISGVGFSGPVRTVVMIPGDNYDLHQAIATARAGDVIVGAVDGDMRGGYFGDIMALACRVKGIVGMILDATVRDVDELRSLNFPVFATGICLTDTTKRSDGEDRSAMDIELDGLRKIRGGDWIVADGSAVVHIPQTVLDEVVQNARQRCHREESMREAVLQGVTTLEVIERMSR